MVVSPRTKKWLRTTVIWAGVIAGYIVLVSTVLPALAASGYAGEVIRRNAAEDVDASALFYTESERTMAILHELRDR